MVAVAAVAAVAVVAAVAACSVAPEPPDSGAAAAVTRSEERLEVFASNYPLRYFTERIGGAAVGVTMPSGIDDPAFWEPAPEQIATVQGADLIVLNGAGYEKWARTATLPVSHVIDTTAALTDRLVAEASSITHSHGPEAEHSHGEVAFTTWLDMTLALEQARIIAAALAARLPNSNTVDANFAALESELLALDEALREVGREAAGQPILASHPVYQYLGRSYDMKIDSLHLEAGDELNDNDRADLEAAAKSGVEVMLWEAAPQASTLAFLEQLGIDGIVFAPLGVAPDSGDWLSAMQENIARLRAALKETP